MDGDRQRVWLGFLEEPDHVAYGTLADFVEVVAAACEHAVIRHDEDANELIRDLEALERLRTGHRAPERAATSRRAPTTGSRPWIGATSWSPAAAD